MACKKNVRFYTGVRRSRNAWTTDRESKIYDCYGVLERSAWIWRIVGIFPFTIKAPMRIKKYEINKYYAAYSFLICSTCIGNCVYGMKKYIKWTRNEAKVVNASEVIGARELACLLCMIMASVWRIFRHKEISGIIDTIAGQDMILKKMNCWLHYESNAKIIFVYVSTSSMTVALLLAYDFYASSLLYGSIPMQWLLWIIPLIGQILDLTIFVSLVGLLGLKFRALNEKVRTVVARANSSSPKIIVTSDVCAENLRKIAKAHYSICAVGKRLNSFFAWNMIINVIGAFVILTDTLFSTFIEARLGDKTKFILIGTYIHWIFIRSVPIIVIVAICNWTSQQSIHTGKLIHATRVQKIDSRLYETVKTFSLQLHHQKLDFNAGGFFPLNSRLIQTMVANITTYLVILIQVQTVLEAMSIRK